MKEIKLDIVEINKLGKDYKNYQLMINELVKLDITLNDMETINLWSFKDKEMNWK